MKLTYFCIINLIIITNLFGQSSLQISDYPTASELNQLFTRTTNGELDPFVVIPMVIEKGDKAVKGLNKFLFQEEVEEKNSDTTDNVKANKVYAVSTLDGIGTQSAQQVLYIAALKHPEPEVRGKALEVLSQSVYDRALENNETPDKKLLHILFQSVVDTTILNDNIKIGYIARVE